VYELTNTKNRDHKESKLIFSRWKELNISTLNLTYPTITKCEQDTYTYDPTPEGKFVWYVNFADQSLFVAYGSGLFAQDEIQVAEHPTLGHLKEALTTIYRGSDSNYGCRPITKDGNQPTPILVRGAERLCRVKTGQNAAEGRPQGLYGNHFEKAPEAVIVKATQVFDNPTTTNLICMAAHKSSWGTYTLPQIKYLFSTALTSFTAAKVEAATIDKNLKIVIHTGNWGCGAFGGNLELVVIVQIMAGIAAGIDEIIYHSFDKKGTLGFDNGHKRVRQLLEEHKTIPVNDFLEILFEMHFQWGMSNGT